MNRRRSDVGADETVGWAALEASLRCVLGECRTGPEVVLLAVDDLQVLIGAAVLLVAAGGHRARVRLCLLLGLRLTLAVGL